MVGTAQRVVAFGTFLLLLLGLAGIAVSIYLLVSNFNWSAILSSFQSALIIIFIAISALVFISAVLGLCGSCFADTCCLNIFLCSIILWMLVFVAAGVLGFVFPKVIQSSGCDSGIAQIQQIKQTSLLAAEMICRSPCKCYFQNPNQLNLNTTIDPSYPVSAQGCPNWQPSFFDGINQELEKRFNCAGWCSGTQGTFFRFTDVNKGQPNKACFDAFSGWFQTYGMTIGIISFCVFGVLFLMTFVTKCAINDIRQSQMVKKELMYR